MRLLDRLMVCLYLGVAVLPVTAMALKWHDHKIDGVFPPAPRPKLTFDAVRTEAYQTGTTSWFELKLGLRNWSVWIDNTLLYHVFHETKWGSLVELGRDDMLFERDDINYFNRSGADLPDPREVDKLADRIAALQQRLQREHRALVPLFIPSKTTMFRDQVPALWTRDLGDPRPSTTAVYVAMKRALDARHVTYVDGIELLTTSAEPHDLLWSKSGRHFSNLAGCLCVQQVVQRYTALSGTPPFDYPVQVELRPSVHKDSDIDLFVLLNAWGAWHDPHTRDVQHTPLPDAPPPGAPRAMWISSSFGWVMMTDAQASHRFAQVHLDYYNNTVFEAGANGILDPHQHDEKWRALFTTRELYVLELNETYLTPGSFFGADAIDAIAAELGPEPAHEP